MKTSSFIKQLLLRTIHESTYVVLVMTKKSNSISSKVLFQYFSFNYFDYGFSLDFQVKKVTKLLMSPVQMVTVFKVQNMRPIDDNTQHVEVSEVVVSHDHRTAVVVDLSEEVNFIDEWLKEMTFVSNWFDLFFISS